MPGHVLVLPTAIHPDAVALLEAAPGVTVETLDPARAGEAALREALARADAALLRVVPFGARELAMAPRLRVVARHGVGYDLVDVAALTARGVPLTITPDANAASVAEHALMLLLAVARRVTAYDARVRALRWGTDPALPTFDLAGRAALVVGYGRIGARVARLLDALGMRVAVHDPGVPAGTVRGAGHVPAPDLHAALGEADAVTLHLPASAGTRGMVDARFLGAMRRGAVLINTARGALVDEGALAGALRSGQVAVAGLDVLAEEPAVASSPLLGLPNVVLTPHSAATTAEGMRRMGMDAARCVLDVLEGRGPDPECVVNPEALGAVPAVAPAPAARAPALSAP